MPSLIQSESPPSIILPNFTLNQKEINLRNVEFITPWQGWNNSACGGHPTTTKKNWQLSPPFAKIKHRKPDICIQQSYNNRNNTCYPLVSNTALRNGNRCLRLLSAKSNLLKSSNFKIALSLLAKGLPSLSWWISAILASFVLIHYVSDAFQGSLDFTPNFWVTGWKERQQLATCFVDLPWKKKVEKLSRKFKILAELATLQILTAGLSARFSQIFKKG